jgi:transcriptional regulator with XRE-family HTH domain
MIAGAQIRMARGYLRWSAKELADKAGVAESTIKRMEQGEGFPIARGSNIEAVYKTLIATGIVLVPENGGGVGVRLRKGAGKNPEMTKHARASAPKAAEMAAREIDQLDDKSATGEQRASRKRRLIAGPKEFRDIRKDRAKPKRK